MEVIGLLQSWQFFFWHWIATVCKFTNSQLNDIMQPAQVSGTVMLKQLEGVQFAQIIDTVN